MSGRKPIAESDLPKFHETLGKFPLRDQTLILLGLNSGFRINELLSLNVGDVWADGTVRPQVRVTRAKLKGGTGERRRAVISRSVPLNDTAKDILSRYLKERLLQESFLPADPLFPSRFHGQRLTRWRANQLVHQVMSKAGLDHHQTHGTHSLRKTFCRSIYEVTKFDLNLTRAIMGHAHVSTTQLYLHVDEGSMEDAVMKIGRKVTPPPAPSAPQWKQKHFYSSPEVANHTSLPPPANG